MAHVLLDGFLGLLGLPLDAHPEHHFGGDREQQQAAGDTECRQRDGELVQEPVSDQRGAGENRGRDETGAKRDPGSRRNRPALGHREEGRRQADRVDHDQKRHQGRDQVIERHDEVVVEAGIRPNPAPARNDDVLFGGLAICRRGPAAGIGRRSLDAKIPLAIPPGSKAVIPIQRMRGPGGEHETAAEGDRNGDRRDITRSKENPGPPHLPVLRSMRGYWSKQAGTKFKATVACGSKVPELAAAVPAPPGTAGLSGARESQNPQACGQPRRGLPLLTISH